MAAVWPYQSKRRFVSPSPDGTCPASNNPLLTCICIDSPQDPLQASANQQMKLANRPCKSHLPENGRPQVVTISFIQDLSQPSQEKLRKDREKTENYSRQDLDSGVKNSVLGCSFASFDGSGTALYLLCGRVCPTSGKMIEVKMRLRYHAKPNETSFYQKFICELLERCVCSGGCDSGPRSGRDGGPGH